MTKRLVDYTKVMEGTDDLVCRLIRSWQPRSFDLLEKDHEQDLYAWFRRHLPDVPMMTQYGIAKGKADIVIQDGHLIELKVGFTDVGEFDRCIGQLERYRQKWVEKDRGPVYLVIVGDSDPEFRDLMVRWFERTNKEFFLTWFFMIEMRSIGASSSGPAAVGSVGV